MKALFLSAALLLSLAACGPLSEPSSDKVQAKQQEVLLQEATSQVGMPAIKNFRERKLLKQLLEMRDQEGLITYTYTFAEASGELTFLCNSIGYGLPYATQFTNPERMPSSRESPSTGNFTIPQADPNGLFSPASADGTWVLCLDPNDTSGKGKTSPIYSEPKLIVSPFKLR
jgi:predicted small lipoprotein YifL